MKFTFRVLSLVLVIGLCLAPAGASAAGYPDTVGRSDAAVIARWSDYGVMEGFEGNFNPDGALTRAQFAAVLQRIIKHPTPAKNTYGDLYEGAWYTHDALCMVDLGVMGGSGGRFAPNAAMTREMAVTTLARAFSIWEDPDISMFSDSREISQWAGTGVGAMAKAGYIKPYSDGRFRPKAAITRSEFLAVLDAMFGGYYYQPGRVPHTTIDSNVLANTSGISFFYTESAKNFYLTSGVGKETVFLYGCKVKDTLYLNGGGEVRIMDPVELTAYDVTSSTYTSLVVGVKISRAVVNAPWDMKLFMSPAASVNRLDFVRPGRSYTFGGKCKEINIKADNTSLQLADYNIDNFNADAPGLSIKGTGGFIHELTVTAPMKTGSFVGIQRATVLAGGSGSEFHTLPNRLTIAPGVTVTVAGRTVTNTGDQDMVVR